MYIDINENYYIFQLKLFLIYFYENYFSPVMAMLLDEKLNTKGRMSGGVGVEGVV